MTLKRQGPGLAKSKRARLFEPRTRDLIRCTDYRWRELFERADVVSEGAVRQEAEGPTYYGSTHIRFSHAVYRSTFDTNDLVQLGRMIRNDPHVRLRAMRVACLEAKVRSNAELSTVTTDVTFSDNDDTVSISVDIEAKITSSSSIKPKRASNHRGRP